MCLGTAQNISQRNDGLFNVEQSPLIDDLTLAHLAAGNTADARELQLERLDNAVRRFGADDPRTIPFYAHLGDYYDRSRLRRSAREQFEKALEIRAAEGATNSSEDIGLLRRLVQIDLILGEAESAARDRLAAVVNENLDMDPAEKALSLAVLGDWALVYGDSEQASTYYQQAHANLQQGDSMEVGIFSEPRMLNFIPPLDAVDRGARSKPWSWGTVVMEFNVSATGRASGVETISMEPRIPQLERAYNRRIREAHFRPRLTESRAQATREVRYKQNFRFYVDD